MNRYNQLLNWVNRVKRLWRLRALAQGLAMTLALVVAAFYLALWLGLEGGFSAGRLFAMRIALIVVLALALFVWLIKPLSRRISAVQVARYVEEKRPELDHSLVTAVELGGRRDTRFSPALIDKLTAYALEQCAAIDTRRLVDRREIYVWLLSALAALLLFSLLFWGPDHIRFGGKALLGMVAARPALPNYKIVVSPGDAEVPRGGSQKIMASTEGFLPEKLEIHFRRGGEPNWQIEDMRWEDSGGSASYLFRDISANIEYRVVAGAVGSPQYRLRVLDIPRVRRMRIKYSYPGYTGLEARVVEDQGDISAVRGTRAEIEAETDRPVRAADIVFSDGRAQPMVVSGNQIKGAIEITRNDSYFIRLKMPDGQSYAGSEEFQIEALDDQPPLVSISKPGRDRYASRVEEVFAEARAEDDMGISSLELRFSINGGPEQSVQLFSARARPVQRISGAHTFFLEEFKLQPGDVISYYARAEDTRRPKHNSAASDIYFIRIHRTDREFRQSQAMGNPGEGNSIQQLAQHQKEIIAATWKLIKDRQQFPKKEFDENVRSLALLEGRLKQEAEELAVGIRQRAMVAGGGDMLKLAEFFQLAAAEMGKAEKQLSERELEKALPPEQAAFNQLLRAEEFFREMQLAYNNSSSEGSGEMMQDLEELLALELDNTKNQYETLRGAPRERNKQIDEALEKLRELARRQQELAESMMRRRQSSGGGGSSSSSESAQQQAELARELEKLERQLERLARDEPDNKLSEVNRQLNRALQEMRRSIEEMRQQQGSGASAARALEKLREAERRLSGLERDRWAESLKEMAQRLGRMVEEQRKIEAGVEKLRAGQTPSPEKLGELEERKEQMAEAARQLEQELPQLARRGDSRQQEAQRKVQEAAGELGRQRPSEKMAMADRFLSSGDYQNAARLESEARRSLERAHKNLKEAERSLRGSQQENLAEALSQARDLAEALESMAERQGQGRQARGEQSASGQPGQGELTARDARGLNPNSGRPELTEEMARQLGRELQERRREAADLARLLRGQDLENQIEQILGALRRLEDKVGSRDFIKLLRNSVIEPLEQLELALSERLGRAAAQSKLHQVDEAAVPAGYKHLVYEYYRKLAENK